MYSNHAYANITYIRLIQTTQFGVKKEVCYNEI